ncbi:MAG: helix-turn-helix domain-containing protein [Janthinobacterium lividum]
MKVRIEAIRYRAERKGLNIRRLEDAAGIKHGTVHNIMQGRSLKPTADTLQKIASVLDCSIYDLVIETGKQTEIRPSPEHIWDINIYLECMLYIVNSAKNRRLSLNKEKLLALVDESYAYTMKADRRNLDKVFTNWILDKITY